MKKSEIKAVEMTRLIRDMYYERIPEKNWDEQAASYEEQARHLHNELEQLETEEYHKAHA